MKSNKQKPVKKTYNDNKKGKQPSRGVLPHSDSRCSVDDVHVSGNINDANYYFSNELLKNQLTDISFNSFTGVPLALTQGAIAVEVKIPTTQVFRLNPSAGFTDETEGLGTALNMTSLKLYTQLSANNAKTTNYAPQDITTLFLSLGSAISLASHIKRIFGLAYLYSQRNRTYPKGLITAMRVDYDDLIANFANYRARYNRIINAASGIPIPANVPYLKKCEELYAGVYLDMEGSALAQNYVFEPYSVWALNEQDSSEGSFLETTLVHSSGVTTMNVLLTILDSLFTALLNSSTLNFIYADILRLADKGLNLYTFNAIPDDYVVLPAYNPEIRKWINNATPMGVPTGEPDENYTVSNNVYHSADTNKIVYRPQFIMPFGADYMDRVLNFDYGTYTSDDIVNATRLMAHARLEGSVTANSKTTSVALPDHYVVEASIYFGDEALTTINHYAVNETASNAAVFRLLSAFDWAPILGTTTANGVTGYFGDLNYYTVVDYKYLSLLQDSTYYGLFEIR